MDNIKINWLLWQVKVMKKFYQFNIVTKLFEIIIFIMKMRIL